MKFLKLIPLMIVVGFWGWILSCVSIPEYRAYLVDRLRILGIRSEPLEAPAGTTVTITAFVADPKGEGRPITFLWGVCPQEKGGGTGCTAVTDLMLLGFGITPEVGYTLPAGVTGTTVVGLMVTAGTEYEMGFKRVFVSDYSSPNHNPKIDQFLIGGTECTETTCIGGDTMTMTVNATPGSVEEYEITPGNWIKERLFYSWFVTGGELKEEITLGETGKNEWYSKDSEGNKVTETTLYIVLRDGRGGIDWMTKLLKTQ